VMSAAFVPSGHDRCLREVVVIVSFLLRLKRRAATIGTFVGCTPSGRERRSALHMAAHLGIAICVNVAVGKRKPRAKAGQSEIWKANRLTGDAMEATRVGGRRPRSRTILSRTIQ
jgi:hypothetical protein